MTPEKIQRILSLSNHTSQIYSTYIHYLLAKHTFSILSPSSFFVSGHLRRLFSDLYFFFQLVKILPKFNVTVWQMTTMKMVHRGRNM